MEVRYIEVTCRTIVFRRRATTSRKAAAVRTPRPPSSRHRYVKVRAVVRVKGSSCVDTRCTMDLVIVKSLTRRLDEGRVVLVLEQEDLPVRITCLE